MDRTGGTEKQSQRGSGSGSVRIRGSEPKIENPDACPGSGPASGALFLLFIPSGPLGGAGAARGKRGESQAEARTGGAVGLVQADAAGAVAVHFAGACLAETGRGRLTPQPGGAGDPLGAGFGPAAVGIDPGA